MKQRLAANRRRSCSSMRPGSPSGPQLGARGLLGGRPQSCDASALAVHSPRRTGCPCLAASTRGTSSGPPAAMISPCPSVISNNTSPVPLIYLSQPGTGLMLTVLQCSKRIWVRILRSRCTGPALHHEEGCHGYVKQHLRNTLPCGVRDPRARVDLGSARLPGKPRSPPRILLV
jgi:hypothetical protein